jgi:hypothetical protein
MIQTDKEFHRYTIVLNDFEKALDYLVEAKKQPKCGLAYEALLSMAVICYYLPFSRNEKSATAKAQLSLSIEDMITLSPSEHELHKLCKELRNKAIAHSGYEYNPTDFCEPTEVIMSRQFSIYPYLDNLQILAKLTQRLIDACHASRAPYTT